MDQVDSISKTSRAYYWLSILDILTLLIVALELIAVVAIVFSISYGINSVADSFQWFLVLVIGVFCVIIYLRRRSLFICNLSSSLLGISSVLDILNFCLIELFLFFLVSSHDPYAGWVFIGIGPISLIAFGLSFSLFISGFIKSRNKPYSPKKDLIVPILIIALVLGLFAAANLSIYFRILSQNQTNPF